MLKHLKASFRQKLKYLQITQNLLDSQINKLVSFAIVSIVENC